MFAENDSLLKACKDRVHERARDSISNKVPGKSSGGHGFFPPAFYKVYNESASDELVQKICLLSAEAAVKILRNAVNSALTTFTCEKIASHLQRPQHGGATELDLQVVTQNLVLVYRAILQWYFELERLSFAHRISVSGAIRITMTGECLELCDVRNRSTETVAQVLECFRSALESTNVADKGGYHVVMNKEVEGLLGSITSWERTLLIGRMRGM